MRLALVFVSAAALFAQDFEVKPLRLRQGETFQIRSRVPVAHARMKTRTVRMFPDSAGTRLGLMPVPLEQKPGSYEIELLSDSGAVLHRQPVVISPGNYPEQDIVIGKATATLRAAPGEAATVGAFSHLVTDTRYWTEPFREPVPGCVNSLFGVARLYNGKPTGQFHRGIDQRGAQGTPITAITGGIVRLVRPFRLQGNFVGIDHGQG